MTEWDMVQRLVTQLVEAEKERAKLSLRVEYTVREAAQKSTALINAQNRINELEERSQGRSLTDVERDLLREHHEHLARVVGEGAEAMNITEMIDALEHRIKGLDHLAAAFRVERDRAREQREAVEEYLSKSLDSYHAIRDMLSDALGVTRGLFGIAHMLDQLKGYIPPGVTLPDLAYAWKVRQEQEKEGA